jgi:hypothetical protein
VDVSRPTSSVRSANSFRVPYQRPARPDPGRWALLILVASNHRAYGKYTPPKCPGSRSALPAPGYGVNARAVACAAGSRLHLEYHRKWLNHVRQHLRQSKNGRDTLVYCWNAEWLGAAFGQGETAVTISSVADTRMPWRPINDATSMYAGNMAHRLRYAAAVVPLLALHDITIHRQTAAV